MKPEHLCPKAVVCIRQSSDKQALQNKGSERLQYDVAGRTRELGWKYVEVIDDDLEAWASLVTDSESAQDFYTLLPAIIESVYLQCFQGATSATFRLASAGAHQFDADLTSLISGRGQRSRPLRDLNTAASDEAARQKLTGPSKWGELEIFVPNDFELEISPSNQSRSTVRFEDMGFADGRGRAAKETK